MVLLALLVFVFACGKSSESKSKADEQPPADKTAPANVDVSFLVKDCVDTGFDADKCTCVGEQARANLSAELIEKLRNAPTDDDLEAAQEYYSGDEVQTVVSFLQATSKKCGIEGEG